MSLSAEITIEVDGTPETATRVGAAALGVIYRSATAWYRIYPFEMTLRWKNQLRQQAHATLPGCARILSFQTQEETGWHVLRYDVPAEARSLSEVIETMDVLAGLEGVALALRMLPQWWSTTTAPLGLMPTEIVLTGPGTALYLPNVPFRAPLIAELFDEPERLDYLPPELLRGTTPIGDAGQAADLYSLGVALLQCFYTFDTAAEPGEALLRAAIADVGRQQTWRESLPYWIEQLEPTPAVIALAHQLTAVSVQDRVTIPWSQTADYLANCRSRMLPLAAVRERRQRDQRKALELFEDLAAQHASPELLLEGADLAQQLGNEVQALRLLEQAITMAPDEAQPYLRQFDLIASARRLPYSSLRMLYVQDLEFSTRFEIYIRRDFNALARLAPSAAEDRELVLARHYLWRGETISTLYQSARDFIRERLYDTQGVRRSWKLELRLIECEALYRQGGRSDAAVAVFNEVTADIPSYEQRPHVDQHAVQQAKVYALQLRDLLTNPPGP